MIVFDGTYSLQPDSGAEPKPDGRLLCSWRVRIINLAESKPTVRHLKPTIVIVNPAGPGTGLTSCAEGVGKKISRDFSLDAGKVLWIEHLPSKTAKWHTAVFRPQVSVGSDINYDIQWRPATPNEIELIKPFIAEFDDP